VSDFLLQKDPRRGEIYHQPPGIRYSNDLKKWVVTSPDLIRQAMYDDAFSVPSYDVTPMIEKLGVDLRSLNELRKYFPLAVEGERHKQLRERFARHVAARSRPALDVLSAELGGRLAELADLPDEEPFCLQERLLKPTLRKTVLTLADIDPDADFAVEELPLLFDSYLSANRRLKVNAIIRDALATLPFDLAEEEKYFRVAVVALASNTTLASVSHNILERIAAQPDTPLAAIDWGSEFTRTGLPLIEKFAVRDAMLGGQLIRKGEHVRLFIESEGVAPDGSHSYSDVFFAVGPHKCVGMNFSRQLWGRVASGLGAVNRKLRVLEVAEREKDYVFNLPERMRVEFHG
jgi:cytochrome P450